MLRPIVRVGDTWRFAVENRLTGARHEETRRVMAIDTRQIVCENASTDPNHPRGRYVYTREWNLLERPGAGDADTAGVWRWTPHYPHVSFPLTIGQRRGGVATVENAVTGTRNVHSYITQVGPAEHVVVPAGRFRVLRVRYESTVTSNDGQQQLTWRNLETLHYAAAANLFVQFEHLTAGPDGKSARDTRHQLLEYRRA